MTETLTQRVMTMEEIEREFDGEWVIIDDLILDEKNLVIGGKVIYHSKNVEDVDRESLALPAPINIAVFYIGEDDTDICWLL